MTDPVPSKEMDADADYIELLRACDPVEALKRDNERLKAEIARITGEREPPHCSSCSCHLPATEPLPRYQCMVAGCPANHVSKWDVCPAQPPGDAPCLHPPESRANSSEGKPWCADCGGFL